MTVWAIVTMFVLMYAAELVWPLPRRSVAERVAVLLVTAVVYGIVMYPVHRGMLEYRDRKRAGERER